MNLPKPKALKAPDLKSKLKNKFIIREIQKKHKR